MIERFRVRPERLHRVEAEAPGLLQRHVARRLELTADRAYVQGPFLVTMDEDEWWVLSWEFPTRAAADALRALWQDPLWLRHVEMRISEGPKHDPRDGLPGFGPDADA